MLTRWENTYAGTNNTHYFYVNTTSRVKTYLDKTRQMATWPQVSPKYQGQTGFLTYSPKKKCDQFCLLTFTLSLVQLLLTGSVTLHQSYWANRTKKMCMTTRNSSIPLDRVTQALTLSGPGSKTAMKCNLVLTPAWAPSYKKIILLIFGPWFFQSRLLSLSLPNYNSFASRWQWWRDTSHSSE